MVRPQIGKRGLRALPLACESPCGPRTRRDHGTTPHPARRGTNPERRVPKRQANTRNSGTNETKGEAIMLFIKVRIHRILAVLLVVVALAAISIPPAPIGVAPVSADSRCHQHYDHTHGWGLWRRTDAYQDHGTNYHWPVRKWGHWVDHENSREEWCFFF